MQYPLENADPDSQNGEKLEKIYGKHQYRGNPSAWIWVKFKGLNCRSTPTIRVAERCILFWRSVWFHVNPRLRGTAWLAI